MSETTNTDTTTYAVSGMSCGHCEAAVREEVEALAGVTAAVADASAGTLVVTGSATADAVAEAVDAAGYTLTR